MKEALCYNIELQYDCSFKFLLLKFIKKATYLIIKVPSYLSLLLITTLFTLLTPWKTAPVAPFPSTEVVHHTKFCDPLKKDILNELSMFLFVSRCQSTAINIENYGSALKNNKTV